MNDVPVLAPRLVVSNAAKAIDLYTTALGAEELERYTHEDKIVHAALRIGDSQLTLKDTDGDDRDPAGIGGTPVFLSLNFPTRRGVDDAVGRMVEAGATLVFPFEERPEEGYGGRLTDPFGHVWMLGSRPD